MLTLTLIVKHYWDLRIMLYTYYEPFLANILAPNYRPTKIPISFEFQM